MNIKHWQKIVIKVGSALIAPEKAGCSSQYLRSIADFIKQCRGLGIQVVLVSSGSIAAGSHLFNRGTASNDEANIVVKKAMAAAGQAEMMATWDELFDFPSAQLLLTHADLRNRVRYESIRETITTLLAHDILPIINENDAVTTDKLKVGDNDNLSAMVATAAHADALIICSDIDGLYEENPHLNSDAKLVSDVYKIDQDIYAMAGGATSAVGTGGMKTKIQAAEKAVSHGIDTYIVNGFQAQSFQHLLANRNPGTHFYSHKTPMLDGVHWMRHTTRAQGELIVSDQYDIKDNDSSDLLQADDLLSVNGDFASGDIVMLRKDNGDKLAKVKTNYSSCLLNFVADSDNQDISEQFDKTQSPILSTQYIALMES
ncbi:glutamate 5-kinase [Colwellia chukchiensis]|uniref:Glutamate 5-kinase n=1 Tax=Colwellia chukchiensis TaxID=641665 RepID=A0A1H7QQQ9_9GAMM|nr:glutamate 5-kinase [Colwellia chukchiensis]SEL49955.1 glutamate 5-kinase [Colwellia chukchiensis]